MRAHRNYSTSSLLRLSLFTAGLLLLLPRPAFAVEAQKPQPSLADTIQQQGTIPREQFYGEVKLLHAPNPMDVQFSEDGSVLFSQAETIRLWRSDNGDYLGSIAGPTRFRQFAQLNHSRWLVTVDDSEIAWDNDYDFVASQVLPYLRIWDVTTGACLASHPLNLAVNARRISYSVIAADNQSQTVFVMVHYYDDTEAKYILSGYQGQKLIPVSRFELERDYQSLTCDPRTRQLYLYDKEAVSAFDPVSNKILWTTHKNEFSFPGLSEKSVEHVMAVDHPLPIKNQKSHHNQSETSILLIFAPDSRQLPENNPFLIWGLIDPHSGKPVQSGIVYRESKPIANQSDRIHPEILTYWIDDPQSRTLKAIDILGNQIIQTIPWYTGQMVHSLRIKAKNQKWYLEQEDFRAERNKLIWSRTANRVCKMRGYWPEIELFDSSTGKSVASASGTVNALSKISADKVSASLDWHDVSVFEFSSDETCKRIFHTPVLQNSCIALSTDASNLLVGEISGNAQVWNLSQQQKLATLVGGTDKLLCIAANRPQSKIVACDNSGTIWWWKSPAQSASQPVDTQPIYSNRNVIPTVPHLSESNGLYSINRSQCDLSTDGQLALSFKIYKPYALEKSSAEDLSFAVQPGVNFIAKVRESGSSGSEPKIGIVIASKNGSKFESLTPEVNLGSILLQIKSTADGKFALFVFDTGQVTIVDIQENTLQSIIQTNNREIMDVDYHHDRKTLLVASFRGTVTAWNSETFLKTGSLQLTDARLNLLSSRPAPDGFDLVLGTWDTGLIVKRNAFPTAKQKPQRPAALTYPFK